MNGRRDPITTSYLLGRAVTTYVGAVNPAALPARVIAVLYALAALGPAPVTADELAKAAGVGVSGLRRALEPYAAGGRLVDPVGLDSYQLGAALLDIARQAGADL